MERKNLIGTALTVMGLSNRAASHRGIRLAPLLSVAVMLAAALLVSTQPAHGQTTTTLVSNTGQSLTDFLVNNKLNTEREAFGQVFTTGSDVTEYRLDSIGIRFGTVDASSDPASELTVTLNDANVNRSAKRTNNDVLCTLTNPATFTADAVNTFDAPTSGETCPFLKPETDYAVAVTRANNNTHEISLARTSSQNEDTLTPPTGWTIHNNPDLVPGPDTTVPGAVIGKWTTLGEPKLMLEVKGAIIPPQLTSAITAFTAQSTGWNRVNFKVTVASAGDVYIRWRPESETSFGDNKFSGEPDADNILTVFGFTHGVRYVVQASQDESFNDPAQLEFTHEFNTVIRDVEAIEVTLTTALLKVTVVPGDDEFDGWVLWKLPAAPTFNNNRRLSIPPHTSSTTTLVEDLPMGTTYVLEAYDNSPAHRTPFYKFPRASFTTLVPAVFSTMSLTIVEGESGTYTLALGAEPTARVTINLSTDGEVTTQPTSLRFTRSNWDTPQTVSVNTNHDDDAVDDAVTITHTVTSDSAAEYAALANLDEVRVTVVDGDLPAPDVSVRTGHGYAALSWAAMQSVSPVLRYEVRWRESNGGTFNAWQSVGLATSYRVQDLTNGRTYEFQVRAVNANGNGEEGSVRGTPTATVTGTPTVPQHLNVKNTVSGIAKIGWTRPANALQQEQRYAPLAYSIIGSYELQVCNSAVNSCRNRDNENWYVLAVFNNHWSRDFTHQVLAPGVIRDNRYRVRAININGVASPWSNIAELEPTVIEHLLTRSPQHDTVWADFRVVHNPDGKPLYVRYTNLGTGSTVDDEPLRLTRKGDYRIVLTDLSPQNHYRVDLDFVDTFDSDRKLSGWVWTPRQGVFPLLSIYGKNVMDAELFTGGAWQDAGRPGPHRQDGRDRQIPGADGRRLLGRAPGLRPAHLQRRGPAARHPRGRRPLPVGAQLRKRRARRLEGDHRDGPAAEPVPIGYADRGPAAHALRGAVQARGVGDQTGGEPRPSLGQFGVGQGPGRPARQRRAARPLQRHLHRPRGGLHRRPDAVVERR